MEVSRHTVAFRSKPAGFSIYLSDQNPFKSRPLMKTLLSLRILAIGCAGLILGGELRAQINNFDSLNGYAAGLELRLSSRHADLTDLRSPKAGWTLNLEGDFVGRDIDPESDRLKRDNKSQQYALVAGWGTEVWNIGATVGITNAKSDYEEINSPAPVPTTGSVDTEGVSGRLWAVRQMGAFTFDAALGMAETSYDGVRKSDVGTSTADFDGNDTFGYLRLAYDWAVTDSVLIVPFAGMVWVDSEADGFTEAGNAPDRRIVGDFSTSESNAVFGAKITAAGGAWKPYLALGWFTELSSDQAVLSVKAINGFDLGQGAVPNASDSLFYASLGVDGDLADGWQVRGSVDFYSGGDEEQTGIRLSLGRSW